MKNGTRPSHNRPYLVPPSAPPKLPFGQFQVSPERCVKFPPIKKPAIRGGLRKAGMKQDVQEKPHLDRFIKTAVKIKEAGYGRQM